MRIISSSFLFLFLPLAVVIYYLIPAGKNLYLRNIFLLLISLFFYAWGEPYYVFMLLLLMVFVHIAGKLIDGKQNTVFARIIVFITTLAGIGIIIFFRNTNYYLSIIGKIIHHNFTLRKEGIPLGISFFIFFAVSYVVDIYRKKCNSPKSFLYTALYLSAFFKVTQGPIIEYNKFRSQVENRRTDLDMIYRGTKRFLVGLAKKAIIASNLSGMAVWIFSDGISKPSVVNAWIGCIACLVNTYIDFSAYSDMACGMALLFGFTLPENFNYPYTAHSITEYWQRWHITLIQWFKDYLYYPITLGPSVRFRKFLHKHGVKKETAKKLQNIFVPACVWIPTSLWHGSNINYILWGIANCTIIILEMNRNTSKKSGFKVVGNRFSTILFLILMMPLLVYENTGSTLCYYGRMFGIGYNPFIDDVTFLVLKEYGVFLALGLLFCFPVSNKIAGYLGNKFGRNVVETAENIFLIILSVVSIAFVIKTGSSFFIYQLY